MPHSWGDASAAAAPPAPVALRTGDGCARGADNANAGGFGAIAGGFDEARAASDAEGIYVTDGDVLAEPLLRAVLGFLAVFDALGSAVLTRVVGSDFRSKASSARSALSRENVSSVRGMVEAEMKRAPGIFDSSGTEALRWARRVILFVDALVKHLLSDVKAELRTAATEAYRTTLALNHPSITQSIFENALALLPDRAVFLDNLYDAAASDPVDPVRRAADSILTMRAFRAAVHPHIVALDSIFAEDV